MFTGTCMDYASPRAAHLPFVDMGFNEVPDPGNELGVKGIGEGGACGAPPARFEPLGDDGNGGS